MNPDTLQKLARSLTAEKTELVPFLPYLLQDLWELGTPAKYVIAMLRRNNVALNGLRILDLACGKGGIGIPLAREGAAVTMVDIMPEFVDYARRIAGTHGVVEKCVFMTEDVAVTARRERDWDCAVFLGTGDVLGAPAATVELLAGTVRPGGYVVLDETHVAGDGDESVRFAYKHPRHDDWLAAFANAGLTLLDSDEGDGEEMARANAECNRVIARRAAELSAEHLDKSALFGGYLASQMDECADLENTVEGAVCLLRKDVPK